MTSPSEPRESEHFQHEAEHVRPQKRSNVMVYLAVLFGAAFLLMLLTYFMQQRNTAETIDTLKQSMTTMTSMKSIEELQSDIDDLQEQMDELEESKRELEARLKLEQESSAALMDINQKDWEIICAMDWLGEIQELYGRGKYKACRAMMEEFEGNGLKELLPEGAQHTFDGSDAPSPAQRYQDIYDALY